MKPENDEECVPISKMRLIIKAIYLEIVAYEIFYGSMTFGLANTKRPEEDATIITQNCGFFAADWN